VEQTTDFEFVYGALLLYGSKVILAIIALPAVLKVIGGISTGRLEFASQEENEALILLIS